MGRAPQILVVQHEPGEGPGTLGEVLSSRGAELRVVHPYRGEAVPRSVEGYAGLAVLGGSMGAYELDQYPHLRDELAAIDDALSSGTPLLGICLGAQLLAAALGARVAPMGRYEVGWHEVQLNDAARGDPLWTNAPATFVAFHWHGDTFPLPVGAVRIASSAACVNQAFRHGLAFGVQFHLEVTEEIVHTMAEGGRSELHRIGCSAQELVAPMAQHMDGYRAIARGAFEAWSSLALAGTGAPR